VFVREVWNKGLAQGNKKRKVKLKKIVGLGKNIAARTRGFKERCVVV